MVYLEGSIMFGAADSMDEDEDLYMAGDVRSSLATDNPTTQLSKVHPVSGGGGGGGGSSSGSGHYLGQGGVGGLRFCGGGGKNNITVSLFC